MTSPRSGGFGPIPPVSQTERIARYRELASEADCMARAARSEKMRHAHALMATEWRTLADIVEEAERKLRFS